MGRATQHTRSFASGVLARRAEFRSEYIDFDRGIRVGHLEPDERITQILKRRLAERHGVEMLCDRWGRGVHWQWICWVPGPNRRAKPLSSTYNFASAKFFVAVDRDQRVFQSGFQVERAPVRPRADDWHLKIEKDWDWHVLLAALGRPPLARLLGRLLREGFRARVGPFSSLTEYDRRSWDPVACRRRARAFAAGEWGGFQLYWPMPEKEVRATPGGDLIEAVMAVFAEVAPAMNLCMYSPCLCQERTPPAVPSVSSPSSLDGGVNSAVLDPPPM